MLTEHNNDYIQEEENYQGDIIEELLNEVKEQRNALKLMIVDLEMIKGKIDKLFPDTIDKRFVRFFEEKVKAATGLFNSILDMRKEINKSLKDEIEIRRKLEDEDNNDGLGDLNIQKLAAKVEKLNKVKNHLKEEYNEKKRS